MDYAHDHYKCQASCPFFVRQGMTPGHRVYGICEASAEKVLALDWVPTYQLRDGPKIDSQVEHPASDCKPALAELKNKLTRN